MKRIARFVLPGLVPGLVGPLVLLTLPVFSQQAPNEGVVAVVTDVRIVDTLSGQDIELLAEGVPGAFEPSQDDGCTFALDVRRTRPSEAISQQFFSTDLIERLTVRAESREPAVTRVCVTTKDQVRSKVALRGNVLTLRLERVETPPELPTDSRSPSAPAEPTPVSRRSTPPAQDRERDLALREAQVEVRELKLEIERSRRQISEQVAVNARLDQQLSERLDRSGQLQPRIDRLLRQLDLADTAAVDPVERFDVALAALARRLELAQGAGATSDDLRLAADQIESVLRNGASELVVTNDDVNVRLSPSTDSLRVAFLPKGVILQIVERRESWSRVVNGGFEGWIFNDLLSPRTRAPAARSDSGEGVDRFTWMVDEVRRLQQELTILDAASAREAERIRSLEDAAAVAATSSTDHQESRALIASLRHELDAERQAHGQLILHAEALEDRLQVAEADSEASLQRAKLEALVDRLERQVVSLASHSGASVTRIQTTEQTNLRVGPGTDQERVALLPKGFELTLLGRGSGWYEARYGDLHGWISADYSRILGSRAEDGDGRASSALDGAGSEGLAPAREPSNARLIDRIGELVAALEQALGDIALAAESEGSPAEASLGSSTSTDPAAPRDDGALLRRAAEALYDQRAAARRGDVEGFLEIYDPEFQPQAEAREAWEQSVRLGFANGDYQESRLFDLSLRKISDRLVEARFSEDGSRSKKRVDLALDENDRWRILLETSEPELAAARP